jgi:hypothetical protein
MIKVALLTVAILGQSYGAERKTLTLVIENNIRCEILSPVLYDAGRKEVKIVKIGKCVRVLYTFPWQEFQRERDNERRQ